MSGKHSFSQHIITVKSAMILWK